MDRSVEAGGASSAGIRITYDHGKAVSSETDDNSDGVADSRTRFTYTSDKIVEETDFDANGKYERADELTLERGRVVADVAKMATGRYTWSGERLVTQQAIVDGSVQDTVKYSYDCE